MLRTLERTKLCPMLSDVKNAVTRWPTEPASVHTGRSVNVFIPFCLSHAHTSNCVNTGGLTYSGRHPSALGQAQDKESSPVIDNNLPLYYGILTNPKHNNSSASFWPSTRSIEGFQIYVICGRRLPCLMLGGPTVFICRPCCACAVGQCASVGIHDYTNRPIKRR